MDRNKKKHHNLAILKKSTIWRYKLPLPRMLLYLVYIAFIYFDCVVAKEQRTHIIRCTLFG